MQTGVLPMRCSQRGLSLIELMVSITIGLIVIGAVSYAYLGSKGAYRGNESVARIQEAGRFALDAMTRDIRRAGAMGCASVASIINKPVVPTVLVPSSNSATQDPTVLMLDSTSNQPMPIYGISPAAYTPLPATQPTSWLLPSSGSGANKPANAPAYWGGDILQVQIASGLPERMSANVDPVNDIVTIASNTTPSGATNFAVAPSLALLADCSSAAVFQITAVSGATPTSLTYSTTVGAMPGSFSVNTFPTVQHFDQVTYYVGQVGNGQTALYRYSMDTGAVEAVVANVQDLDIQYGVGSNGSMASGVYKKAGAMASTDWPNVISVRVSLIAVGDQQGVAPAAQNLGAFHGGTTSWTASDTRLRQVFSGTAALRDRLQ